MHGWRQVGKQAATVAVAAGVVAAGTPAWALNPSSSDSGCYDYGAVVEAPRGTIARDDSMTLRKDPLATWVARHPNRARAAAEAGATVTVPVAFHIISSDNTRRGGNVSDAGVAAQMRVLDEAYAGTGFDFELVETTRTVKESWFNLFYAQGGGKRFERGSHKEIRVKKALHTGGSETLNVYTAALGKRLLGWAYFPSSFTGKDALPRFFDGVVIDYRSLPGGAFRIYNEGDTLTHEAGHWLGLYHTFQDGCSAPGDRVEDTPYEASPQFYCEERDSCPQPGTDPIHNFMDYTPDACMSEFTQGQAVRMRQTWDAYRDVA